MKRPTVAAVLLVALMVSTAGLGVVLSAGGGIGGDSRKGPPQANVATPNPSLGPFLLVSAVMIENFSASGSGILVNYTSTGTDAFSVNTTSPVPPASLNPSVRVPLQGVDIVVQGLSFEGGGVRGRGEVHSYSVITNSSGMGEIYVPPGNFSVTALGPNFSFAENLPFRQNSVTSLSIEVIPMVREVQSLMVQNQDTLSGIEATGTIYAQLTGNASLSTQIPSELVGYTRAGATSTSIGVTIEGSYSDPKGTLVAMKPSGASPVIPATQVAILQYKTESTVSLIAL
jgi:hypothetical protein